MIIEFINDMIQSYIKLVVIKLDNETKQMFNLILEKLDNMDSKINNLDTRMTSIETRMTSIETRMTSIETRMTSMETRMTSIETRMTSIEARQEEMYIMQRSLEENIKVTRAEQDKMMHMVADIQGKVTRLANEVEEHETVIKQIRAIK